MIRAGLRLGGIKTMTKTCKMDDGLWTMANYYPSYLFHLTSYLKNRVALAYSYFLRLGTGDA